MSDSDGMTTHSDGTVSLLGARLRRPTLGEFRKLREGLWGTQEDVEGQRDTIIALTEDKDAGSKAASAKEANRLSRVLQLSVEDQNVAWLRAAVRMLGDGAEIPADDDLPMWCAETETRGELFAHWKAIPASPGDR